VQHDSVGQCSKNQQPILQTAGVGALQSTLMVSREGPLLGVISTSLDCPRNVLTSPRIAELAVGSSPRVAG
jgi:hypothetical protein